MSDRIEQLKKKYSPEQKLTRAVSAVKSVFFPLGIPDYIEKPFKEGVAKATDPYGYNFALEDPLWTIKDASKVLKNNPGLSPEERKLQEERRDSGKAEVLKIIDKKIKAFKSGIASGIEEDHPMVKKAIEDLELSKKTFEGYYDQDYADKTIKRREAHVGALKGRIDLMRVGLGLPQQYGTVEKSKHIPTKGAEPGDTFYDFTEESGLRPKEISSQRIPFSDDGPQPLPPGRNVLKNKHSVLRSYTQDTSNPEYTSYYDKWDFLPGMNVLLEGTGFYKSPNVYGRLYPEQKKKLVKPVKKLSRPPNE